MEKWICVTTLVILVRNTINIEDSRCKLNKSNTGTQTLMCHNVTGHFFHHFQTNPDRAFWFSCENCTLPVIEENTFNFPKNNFSFVTLSRNNVTTIERFAFDKLPLLKMLILKENKIKQIHAQAFVRNRRLLQLDLSKNKLQLLNSLFVKLENLDILNLNQNLIERVDKDAFDGLINLKYLYLNHNKIRALNENIFQYLVNLKILYLEDNLLTEIHPLLFNNLSNLNYLYLNNNSISYLVQYNFKQLTSLVDLQLIYNNLTEIQTSSFNGMKNLRYLYLGHNRIETVRPYGFIGLNSLLLLDLIGNKFDYFTLDYFKNMANLNTIWLENNSMRNFSVAQTSDSLDSLMVLDLIGNKLRTFNFKMLYYKVPNLREIFVGGNELVCNFSVNMYNFFVTNNVSVCLDSKCNQNGTEQYIEDICDIYENVTEILPTDFVVNSTNRFTSSKFCFLLLSVFYHYLLHPLNFQ